MGERRAVQQSLSAGREHPNTEKSGWNDLTNWRSLISYLANKENAEVWKVVLFLDPNEGACRISRSAFREPLCSVLGMKKAVSQGCVPDC